MTVLSKTATINIPSESENQEAQKIDIEVVVDSFGHTHLELSNVKYPIRIKDSTGLRHIAAAESKISYINPKGVTVSGVERGELFYRGYDVQKIATNLTFLETAMLLLDGELPNKDTLKEFADEVRNNRILDKQTESIINTFDRQTSPAIVMMAAITSLASRYEGKYEMSNPADRRQLAIRMIAKMPTITAHILKHDLDQRTVAPDENLGHAANFLHMMFSTQAKTVESDPKHIKMLDMILTLHADHQLAASTHVARAISSCGTSSILCLCSAVSALSGPLHGGANEKVIQMLEDLNPDDIPQLLQRAKDKSDPFKLFGFGHRIYKAMDPRAVILRELAMSIVKDAHAEKPNALLETAIKLEEAALQDPYFIERKLYPNCDFYSGIAMMALGIPTSLFPLIFAVGRTAGWLAHIEESNQQSSGIIRPEQFYSGPLKLSLDWP